MEKLKELAEKYSILVKKTLKDNEKILIDSFAEYYGEDYRSIIEARYKEITYAYYIDWRYISKTNILLQKLDNETIIQNLKELKESKPIWRNLNIFSTSLIGTTNDMILEDKVIKYIIFYCLWQHRTRNFNYCNNNYYRVILFPLFMATECSIIHEINHAITSNIMFQFKNKVIEKKGINVLPDKKAIILEELLNEIASRFITDIFKRKGGDLSSFCINVDLYNVYQNNFHLINEFFANFKSYIDKARISGNQKELLNRIGKEEFYKFASLVNDYFRSNAYLIDEKTKNNQILSLEKILNKMKLNSLSAKDLTEEDLNNYYRLLEEQGRKVTILNNLDTPKL